MVTLLARVGCEPTTNESSRLSCQTMGLTHTQSKIWRATPTSSLCSVLTFHFNHCLCQSPHFAFKETLAQVIKLVREWIDRYGIHHWRIFRSSYQKLAWVGFEPTTTRFHSDAVTDWTIKLWVQLVLSANFVQLLQVHLFIQC